MRDVWVVTVERRGAWGEMPLTAFRRYESAVRFLERDIGAEELPSPVPKRWRHGDLTYRIWWTEVRR